MPKYAAFDNTQSSPQRVTGWYDTDALTYPNLPTSIVEVTDAQWTARLTDPSAWSVSGATLAAYTPPAPPAPTLAQQAQAAMSAGITLTLSGTLTLAATLFPTDAATQTKLGAVVTVLGATGAFPDGASTYPLKDASGAWHTLTVAQYKTVAGAIATYVAALDLIADGNPLDATGLPAADVALTLG